MRSSCSADRRRASSSLAISASIRDGGDGKAEHLRALNQHDGPPRADAARHADAAQALHVSSPNPVSMKPHSASSAACSSSPSADTRQHRAGRRRQKKNAHDALAVHRLRAARHLHVRLKPRREMHEPRRRPRVQPQLIGDGHRSRTSHLALTHLAPMLQRTRLHFRVQQIRRHPDGVAPHLAHLARHAQQIGRALQVRQLDQHRQIDARDDLDTVGLEKRQAKIRRRAAEHVGQDQHAVRALHARDRAGDRLARDRRIVVPADRHRDKLRQLSDNRLRRVHQLVRELPVGDDNDANHQYLSKPLRRGVRGNLPLLASPDRFYSCVMSRWCTRTRAPATPPSVLRSASAIITDRWRPPVQPMAIVR